MKPSFNHHTTPIFLKPHPHTMRVDEPQLQAMAAALGVTIIDTGNLPAGHHGLWDHQHATIYLDARLSSRERRWTLAHELVHARAGHHGPQAPVVEAWVDEQAAAMLILPEDYREAEIIHDGNSVEIAKDLGVPPSAITAWRRWWARHTYRAVEAHA